ncbi:Piwi domain-containing protein, partial [Amylostereum chailletii]
YREQRVDSWALEFLREGHNSRALAQLTPGTPNYKRIKTALKNIRVFTTTPQNMRSRPIRDIIHNAGDYEFDDDTINQRITEYYARRHGYRLQHPNSFGLRFGPGGKIVVPAEVCIIERGQIYKKVLPSEMANEMLLFSAVSPQRRITDIVDAVRGNFLSYHNSDFVSEVGMRVSRHPLEVPGRLLTPPKIKYKSNTANMVSKTLISDDQPGVWNLVNQRFHHAGDPSTWAVVDFSGMLENAVGRFVQELRGACVAAGTFKVNPAFRILRGNPHSVTRSLEAASRPARPNEHKPNLLLIVVPDNAASVIRDIKVWGDCTVGMCTQCVKRGKAQTARNQYHNNVALKINVKLGGVNSIPDSDVAVGLRNMPTMIGASDIRPGHPGPGVQDRPSITSVVASTDPYMSRYSAYVRIQSPRVEIIEHLEEMILEAMENFTSINQEKLPRRIIFFRDGVSEGEYDAVHRDEIPAIYRAWTSLLKIKEKKDALVLTFIVVGKRHHIRFFPTERPDPTATDRSGNVHGGLVVDQGISTPTALDFYLQSHSGLKGTSRSGHYVVLLNEIKLTMDQLQELCYFLCFVYARATRAVSIPAPVYCECILSPYSQGCITHLGTTDADVCYPCSFRGRLLKDNLAGVYSRTFIREGRSCILRGACSSFNPGKETEVNGFRAVAIHKNQST